MAFNFEETAYAGNPNHFGDDDWFEFGPGGILGVHLGDTNKPRPHRYFAPGAWRHLLTDQPPGPPTPERREFGFPDN